MKKAFRLFRESAKENLKLILVVFCAFAIMVSISLVFVTDIVGDQMDAIATESMNTMATAVEDNLFAKELLFTDIARGVKRLRNTPTYNGKDIVALLSNLQEFYTSDKSPIPDFLKTYVFINGEFFDGSGWVPPEGFDCTERPWYIEAINAKGEVAFSEPYLDADTGKVCISYSQIIHKNENGNYDVLAMDINLGSIAAEIEERQIDGDGYGVFISDEFSFIVHEDSNFIIDDNGDAASPKTISDSYAGYAKIENMLRNGEEVSGVRISDYNGADSLVFVRPLFNGWYIGVITARSHYISASVTLGLIIGVVGLALSVLLSVILIRTSNKMKQFQEESTSKSTFLARMSHELRTPMNAILGMTEIAKKSEDPKKLKYCIDRVDTASNQLLEIINELLDMSKIETGKFYLTKEKVDFEYWLDQIRTSTELKTDSKKLSFTVETDENVPKSVLTDPLHLAQVLNNLLDNAIKFTPEGGNVSLRVKVEEKLETHNMLRFEVEDTGVGIAEDVQERLFEAFEQADNSISRHFGGVGLGLPISQNIVNMMGGRIKVDSEVGKGSCFHFSVMLELCDTEESRPEIPEEPETPAEIETPAEPETDDGIFKGKSLLLVGDVEVNREIMRALLEDTMIDIDMAENGQIAVEKFAAAPDKYDIIFMDVHMPVMDGITATVQIRALDHSRAKTVPIIALTADLLQENVDSCIDAGMNTHTGKPVDIDKIISLIEKYAYS